MSLQRSEATRKAAFKNNGLQDMEHCYGVNLNTI